MTLAELIENWEDYQVYYGTKASPNPAGIMFDPKNDDTTLVGDSWIKIADQQTLIETIRIIETTWGDGEVLIIKGPGPDSLFFGYMYLPLWRYGTTFMKLVDEQTLYVGSIPPI